MSKKTNWVKISVVFVMILLMTVLTIADDLPGIKWLKEVMDQHHTSYAVYKDFISAGNNFSMLGQFGTATNMTVDANYTNSTYSGLSNNLSCIKVTYVPTTAEEYVGWYYLNGVSTSGTGGAVVNWGSYPDAGVNLTGSTNITFWAKGTTGMEQVKFVALGVGRNSVTGAPTMPFCGSSATVTTGTVTLSTSWTKYTISLTGKDLSYVLGGFGWSMEKPAGAMGTQVFYIDQIEYNGMDRTSEPRLLTSYKSIISDNDVDVSLRNTAYTYDSCLAALAFLAVGEYERARNILDALVYVQNNDRYYTDGRIRNAYQSGNLALPAGWLVNGKGGCARMPGVWIVTNEATGASSWEEDRFAVSTDSGNIAWTMLAFITGYDILKDQKYLDAAKVMGDWVQINNASSNDLHIEYSLTTTNGGGYTTNTHVYENQRVKFDGYSGQFDGWGGSAVKHAYKSIEHNLDLFVVFQRLYDITSENKWLDRAIVASNFSMKMWESTAKKFLVGTEFKYDSQGVTNQVIDGTTVTITITNYTKEVIDQTNHSDASDEFHEATDAQAWMILALRLQNTDYTNALHYVVNNAKYSNTWGFDYNINRPLWEGGASGRVHPDAIWYEGTAQMATAFMISGDFAIATNIVTEVTNGRAPSGGQPAAGPDDDHDKVSTGFWLPEGEWFYYRREHVGATSWAVIAEKQRNMFWIGTSDEFLDPGETFSHSSFSSTNTSSSSSDVPTSSNLLVNPSFEGWTGWGKNWWPSEAGILNLTGAHSRTSNAGMYIYTHKSGGYSGASASWLDSAEVDWGSYKIARASVYYKTTSPTSIPAGVMFLEINFLASGGGVIGTSRTTIDANDISAATNTWQKLELTSIQSPQGTTKAVVLIGLEKEDATDPVQLTISVDDAELVMIDPGDFEIPETRYIVYSETTAGNEYFVFDASGEMEIWNNMTSTSNITTQYEGFSSFVFNAPSGDWFGIALTYTNGILDLSDYVNGSLNFAVKTTSVETFKVGLIDNEDEMWINFVNGDTNYGVIRDGSWHKVSVPMSHFFGLTDLKNVESVFAVSGDPAGTTVELEIDDIYFSNKAKTNYANQKSRLIAPTNSSIFGITGVNFKWTSGINVTDYRLSLGTTAGGTDIYDGTFDASYRSAFTIAAPKDGSTVYARLYSKMDGNWEYYDYTYTAGNAVSPYTYMILSETAGTERFLIDVDGNQLQSWLFESGPLNGKETLKISENTNSAYEGSVSVELTATNTNYWAWCGIGFLSEPARDLSSFSSGTLNIALQTTSKDGFKIGIKNGETESWIHFVSETNTAGSNYQYGFKRDGNWYLLKIPVSHFSELTSLTSINQMLMLSCDKLSEEFSINIDHIYYDIDSTTPTNHPAQIITPDNGSKLGITGVGFSWTRGVGVTEYKLSIGTTPGGTDVYDQSQGTSRSVYLTSIPKDGNSVYVRLSSKIDGNWQYVDYVYTAGDLSEPYIYSIYSDTANANESYRFDKDGMLYIYKPYFGYLDITEDGTGAYEGDYNWHFKAGNGASMGLTHNIGKDLSDFTNGGGFLNIALKSSTTYGFDIGIKNNDTLSVVNFRYGNDPYGFVRDGNWHMISIPVVDFLGLGSLTNITEVFYFKEIALYQQMVEVDIDNIYYSRVDVTNAPSAPTNVHVDMTDLNWNAASPYISGYIVYHSTNSGSYTTSVNVGHVTSKSVYELGINYVKGVTNYFAIKAYNGAGISAYSAEIQFVDIGLQVPWKDNENGTFYPTYWSTGYALGYEFKPVKDGQIVMLGGKFDPGTRAVKLWNKDTGALLVEQNITGTTNKWTYSNITPFNVYSDTEYTISVLGGRCRWSSISPSFPQTYQDITILSSVYGVGDSIPRYTTTSSMYGGVDIGFVPASNSRPAITSEASNKTATVGTEYFYDVDATDPDSDSLTYSLTEAPSGMVINSTNGEITWTPDISQMYEYTVTIRVDDVYSNYQTQSFTLYTFERNAYFLIEQYLPKVNPSRSGPGNYTYGYNFTPLKDGVISMLGGNFEGTNRKVSLWNRDTGELLATTNVSSSKNWAFEQINPVNIIAGTSYTISLNLTNSDFYLSYYVSGNHLPLTFADFQIENSCRISGDARPTDFLSFSYIYGVADFLFTPATNTGPRITSEFHTIALTNQTYTYDLDAVDPDGDNVTYSLLTNPAGMTINSTNGLISWTPSSALGDHTVTVKVEDPYGEYRTGTYVLSVIEKGQTVWMPNESSTLGSSVLNGKFTLGYNFTAQTNCVITMLGLNANGLVTLKLWNKDSGALLAETNVTSTNTWRYVKIPPVGITNGGNYSVGGYYGEESITKNRTVSPSFPQTYGSITITSGGYNNEWDGEMPDHNYTTSMYGRVDIVYVNYTNGFVPEITSTPDTYAVLSNTYTYDVDAIDYNGDTLTYTLLTNPAGMSINSSSGVITWTPTSTNSENVSVKVEDGTGGEDVQNFVLTVQVAQTPWRTIEHGTRTTYHGYRIMGFYFTPMKDGQIFELAGRYTMGERMYIYDTETEERLLKSDYVNPGGSWTIVAIDTPVDVLAGRRYAFFVYYRGDKYTGVTNIPWTIGGIRIDGGFTENGSPHCPTVSPDTNIIYGGIDFKFKAYTNSTPYITSSPVLHENILSDKEFTYDVDATDPDSDSITYSLLDNPTGMTINSTNGEISWIPSTNQECSTNLVRIKVSDPYGKNTIESFDLVVGSGQMPWRRIENGTWQYNTGYRTTGFYFTPQKDGTITKIAGRYNYHGSMYIYDTVTQDQLIDTPPNIHPGGVWTYVDITDVNVIAGRRYALMVYYYGLKYTGVTNIPWTTGDITIDGGVTQNGSPSCPTTTPETSTIYGGIDMVFIPATNSAPQISSTPVSTGMVSNAYSYDVEATDPDGDTLTYSLLTNPDGMTINSTNGVISWTPTESQTNDHNVTVKVSDGHSGEITQSYVITVSEYADITTLNSEDFETDFGDWNNITGDTKDWTRDSAGTPSGSTGPNIDHTLGTTSGTYIYMETSSGHCYYSGNNVILESPEFNATSYAITLDFYYHMYGADIGTLNVDVYDGSWNYAVWSITNQQHTSSTDPFTKASVDLSAYTGTIKIRLRGVAAGGYRGDMAVDDIEVIGTGR